MSSLRRGHANLLCIVPILSYETGFTPLEGQKVSDRLIENEKWRSRVSIPVPADCEPTALPSELHPQYEEKDVFASDTDF